MAISHIQSSLLLLLVSLFFLPALARSIEFVNCYSELDLVPIKVLSVDVSPDSYTSENPRTGTFTLKANSTRTIPTDEVDIRFTQHWRSSFSFNTYEKDYSICDVTACPIKAGPLTLTFTDVFSEGPDTKPTDDVKEYFRIEIRDYKGLLPSNVMCMSFRFRPLTT